ncbi:MAG TPA: carboxylating nicotinate-nucleotide diphosphorylase [Chitinophagaceae bacterium]|nr:carboxylating nicotinate-nucleotide diphosphorylase [Chitinophagaceae bacterium]
MEFDQKLFHLVDEALKEDVGDGDHSTLSCISAQARGRAMLRIKQDGVLAGVEVAEKIFHYKEPFCIFTRFAKDGEQIGRGQTAFEVEGFIHTILQLERLVLNCMQRMSGIATLTRSYAEKLRGYPTKLLDTRKTTPNFRLLEKEAVRIGGGHNHRFGLYDMILLKDNHVDYCGGIGPAIEKAHAYVHSRRLNLQIEIETRNLDEVRAVLRVGKGKVRRIMLDNFSPEEATEAVQLIGKGFETEASGGINLENIEAYAKSGVDYVSVGGLVHQARSLDMSLKAVID